MMTDLLREKLYNIKNMIEKSIKDATVNGRKENKNNIPYQNGQKAKEALIRSQVPIFELHEFVKQEFINNGVSSNDIFPHVKERKPEIKLNGYFKAKDQDVCVVPSDICDECQKVDWGVLATENKVSKYGKNKESKILATNVRSQLSSLDKNSDTLFERMIAEAFNLHKQYPNLVLGELYMIPLYEYDDELMINNEIGFKTTPSNVEKYITFFSALNNYKQHPNDLFRYNRAALIIADFSNKNKYPKVYKSSKELKELGLLPLDYKFELSELSPYTYVTDLLKEYPYIGTTT